MSQINLRNVKKLPPGTSYSKATDGLVYQDFLDVLRRIFRYYYFTSRKQNYYGLDDTSISTERVDEAKEGTRNVI